MTVALCLNCGELEFGVRCTCEYCGENGSGDGDLGILFTGHDFAEET